MPTKTTQAPSRSPAQQALYIYGNEAGLAVLSFENKHAGMADDLKNWFDHRSDQSLGGAVRTIASDMLAAGQQLEGLPSVPASAQSANARLAASLKDSGAKLSAVVDASGSDSVLGNAMQTYDSAVDEFTKSYLQSPIFLL
jgi:hypothetical protein